MANLTPQAPTTLSTSTAPIPTPEQVANRQLALSPGNATPSPYPGAPGSPIPTAQLNDQAASQLGSYLSSGSLTPSESAQEDTIMGRFNAAQAGTTQQYQSEAQALGDDYSNQLSNLNRTLGNESNATTEARTGFATNTAILRNLQDSGQFRVDQLTKQRDEALLNNNSNMANSLNQLIMNEQNLITQSRQNMATNLGTAATLETPEEKAQLAQQQAQQAAVIQLQSEAPDANISSNDTYDQAIAKFRNSKYYKNNIGQAEATIANLHAQTVAAGASANASNAQAGLAGAQTSQTKALTGIIGGNPSDEAAQAQQLLLNQTDPKRGLTAEQLIANHANDYGGTGGNTVNRILSLARSMGYNQAGSTLGNQGAKELTSTENSGNLFNMFGANVKGTIGPFFNNKLFGAGSTPTKALSTQSVVLKAGNSAGLPPGPYNVDSNGNLTPAQ